jgi:hypothetical protein
MVQACACIVSFHKPMTAVFFDFSLDANSLFASDILTFKISYDCFNSS